MQSVTESRIKGLLSLGAILLGGVTTNCEFCPDPDPTAAPRPKVPAIGDTDPVAGCPDPNRFRAYAALRPEQCDGTDATGNPEMFPVGGELEIVPKIMRKCPDPGPFPVSQSFQVYWTICNVSDNRPQTLLNYELRAFTRSNGVETQVRNFPFSQPVLEPCQCVDVAIAFNTGVAERHLDPADYVFRLTEIYSGTAFEQATVTP